MNRLQKLILDTAATLLFMVIAFVISAKVVMSMLDDMAQDVSKKNQQELAQIKEKIAKGEGMKEAEDQLRMERQVQAKQQEMEKE